MPSEPIFFRWEHTTPPHRKYYELEVELSLFYPKTLTQRWGRLGAGQPQTLQRLAHDPAELERQVNAVRQRRQYHGYTLVAQLYRPMVRGVAA